MMSVNHSKPAILRFADRDSMGHVNSLRLAELMEDARLDFLALIPQREDLEWRLVSMKVDFHTQPTTGSTLMTNSIVTRVGNSSFDMKHESMEEHTLIASGISYLVQVDPEKSISVELEDRQRSWLS
ncbi:thioesterase family protein [Paracoccus sp. (in: a-proteobacteria)]|uniref:acyl-CoA thioesterase n=1 Tax=Paracoccus sp. TaxID=267 RepID=UPI0028B0DEFC|nr:thioesterase family protein [Paracoccus sp. (in: a-proteobacteria)]